MATDLESATDPGEAAAPHPSLKITGIHIRGLKSIGSLDLPGDGLGWNGPIPGMVMVGGINGSGKTTLLEFLVGAFSLFGHRIRRQTFHLIKPQIRAREARIDFQFSLPEIPDFPIKPTSISLLIGNSKFIDENARGPWFGIEEGFFFDSDDDDDHLHEQNLRGHDDHIYEFQSFARGDFGSLDSLGCPSVVYFPSERRTLEIPPTSLKAPGKITDRFEMIDYWKPPKAWADSLESRLYAIRWSDLNAKEEGRPDKAMQFQSYQLAFDRFFEGRKKIRWTAKGELVVQTKDGATHDLSDLSSGEKQVILFMGELLHRWRPGSLILIDAPELHLHEYYQTRLWLSLEDWQKERGGQVIVATQSGHLFEVAQSAMKVLLSRQSL